MSSNTSLVYFSMIRDAAILLAHWVKFSDAAKTRESKKTAIELDITKIIGPKKMYIQEFEKRPEEEWELDAFKEREAVLKPTSPTRK